MCSRVVKLVGTMPIVLHYFTNVSMWRASVRFCTMLKTAFLSRCHKVFFEELKIEVQEHLNCL